VLEKKTTTMYLILWRTSMLRLISKALTEQKRRRSVFLSGARRVMWAITTEKQKRRDQRVGVLASCSLTLLACSCLRLNYLNTKSCLTHFFCRSASSFELLFFFASHGLCFSLLSLSQRMLVLTSKLF
jgi:hypothetical protein